MKRGITSKRAWKRADQSYHGWFQNDKLRRSTMLNLVSNSHGKVRAWLLDISISPPLSKLFLFCSSEEGLITRPNRVLYRGTLMKWCKHCDEDKPETAFQDREDGWGTYGWCNECRRKEGRDKLTPLQQIFIEKTRLFTLRTEYVWFM